MENNSESKKHKESGGSFFKNLFEIKRPVKQQMATLPRTKGKIEQENDNTTKDRLFVRHQSYRRSGKRNKYKKVKAQKSPIEKYEVEPESNVKKLCQQFEENHIKTENNNYEPVRKDVQQDSVIERVLTNRETYLDLLREVHQNVEVKKRIYDKNPKQIRDNKIRSFVEAEDEEATEEYRKSLINEMDMEIAQMKEDGFIDEDENVITNEFKSIPIYSENGTLDFLDPAENDTTDMQTTVDITRRNCNEHQLTIDEVNKLFCQTEINRSSTDSDNQTIIFDQNQIEGAESIETKDTTTEANEVTNVEKDIIRFNSYNDEFTESLSDDLESGLFVVEAYNDEGRELIEVQVMIDRRTVNLVNLDKQSIEEVIKDSDMVFYQNEDHTFNFIQNARTRDLEDIKTENNRELIASTSTSREENLYEYIDTPNDHNSHEPFLVFAPLSNRSTVYSTTSQESSVFDEDDEGIEIGRIKDNPEEIYSNVRRETFCDNQGIVRIERVAFSDNLPFLQDSATVSRSNSTASSKKLEFIVDEIKSTEKKYVEDLAKVVKLYKPYIEKHAPPILKDYKGYLFGNLEKIYRRQRKFLDALEKCGGDVDKIIQCFIDSEHLFEMYPHYFQNKPKADNLLKEFTVIIKEMQEAFEERLDFSAYLLTPLQRLGKYILFLENIEKQLQKLDLPVENAQIAIAIVRDEMSKGNDSVAIESIENSPISKMDYGSFKMREKFNISKPRKVEAMVFLFTNVLVFTTCDPTKLEIFYYYDSIKMIDLRIATFDDLTIHLTDFTKSKKKQNSTKYTYILETKTEKAWKTWKEIIEKMLWDQLVKAKENSMSRQVPRKYKTGERSRIKSTGSSVFYCE